MTWRKILRALLKVVGRTPAPAPPPTPTPAPPPPPPPSPPDGAVELLAAHNARRLEAGLPALVASVKLQMAAQAHADRMVRTGQMAHSGIGDGDLASRLMGVGYRFRSAGENVAMGQRDVPEAMHSWMSSPGHRANILGNFSGAGLAVSSGASGQRFWCGVFGLPPIQVGVYAGQLPYTIGTPEVSTDGKVAASSVTIAAD